MQKRILRWRCHLDVTKRRILGGRRHGKAHFACGAHQKAHSACERWRRVRLSVRVRAQSALFRRVRFSLPAQTWSHLTEKRSLCPLPHVKAQSAPATSRKGALCAGDATRDVTEGRILGGRRHKSAFCVWASKGRALHASGGCVERPFSPICVHSCIPTAARATGWGPRVPRQRGPHCPRDAQVPGPEVHATGAVTQPSTHTSSRSLTYYPRSKDPPA